MHEHDSQENYNFSLKGLFSPLTTLKAIHWIVIIGFVVFANMLFNGFVWDDMSYILANAEVHTFNLLSYFGQTLFNNTGQYRALTEVYFAAIYLVAANSSFLYHFLQLVIHMLNASLVFLLFKKFFKPFLALLLSLIFLIHPMQVESVSYISAAGGVLFFCFGILALLQLDKRKISLQNSIVFMLLLLLSLLDKEAGVLFIIMGICYVYFVNKSCLKQVIVLSTCVVLGYCLIRFGIGGVYFETRPLMPIARLDLVQRLVTLPKIIVFYFQTFLFPINLLIDQQWTVTSPNFPNFYGPLLIIISLAFSFIGYFLKLLKEKKPESKVFFFFSLWTAIGLGLYSQILPLDMTVADRWMYFPLVGMLGMAGCIISLIINNQKNIKFVIAAFMIIIAFLSLRTIIRNADWSNALTLYGHDTKYYTNFLIENDYAQQLDSIGQTNLALVHQRKSVGLFPYEQNVLNLANLYMKLGDTTKADYYYTQALSSHTYISWKYKHIINTYIYYAKLLLLEGDTKKSAMIAEEGVNDYYDFPQRAYLLFLLALANYQTGDIADAKNEAQLAYSLMPTQATAELYNQLLKNEQINIKNYLASIPT
jgi:tetratricopeptide (TPR) repeat protein